MQPSDLVIPQGTFNPDAYVRILAQVDTQIHDVRASGLSEKEQRGVLAIALSILLAHEANPQMTYEQLNHLVCQAAYREMVAGGN